MRELAAQFLALAEKQAATASLMIAHRLMGINSLYTGEIAQGRAHLDQSIALFNPLEHRPLLMGFGTDAWVAALSVRSLALWALGHPEAALADTERAINDARLRGAVTLMFALHYASMIHIACGNYAATKAQYDELIALAHKQDVPLYGALGMSGQGSLLASIGKVSDAVHKITSGISAMRSTGIRAQLPLYLSFLATAYAQLGQLDDAWRHIGEAMSTTDATKERWTEAEINRVAGEIVLKSPKPNPSKAEEYFERALAVARQQQAKSWELRAAMSLARLWRDQGKVSEARELLAPVYDWFTEGFDTRDLKDAKALLEELQRA
jgi:predicted ATPase